MKSISTEIDNSNGLEITSLNNLNSNGENEEFKKAFLNNFNKDSLFNLSSNSESNNEDNNNIEINIDNLQINSNILIGKKLKKNQKFKVKKVNKNLKREITLTTFNTKLNIYLTDKVNKKIEKNPNITKNFFTRENPLLSTKFTQCGIKKTLKNYLSQPLKDFIKKKNFDKIEKIGLDKDSLFNSLLCELIYEYYEYIYSNKIEFNKFLLDNYFVSRNNYFSEEGLINLKFENNSKKVFGYLDFFNFDINKIKDKERNKKLFKII